MFQLRNYKKNGKALEIVTQDIKVKKQKVGRKQPRAEAIFMRLICLFLTHYQILDRRQKYKKKARILVRILEEKVS